MQFYIKNKIAISIFGNSKVFDDIAFPLYYSFNKLGFKVNIIHNAIDYNATNILLGLHDVPNIDLSKIPNNSIIYNFEQLVEGSKGLLPKFIEACSLFHIWDYSKENIYRFKEKFNIQNVSYLPFGYCKEMTKKIISCKKDIDILLFGSFNERRLNIINKLRRFGINAVAFDSLWGIDRDIMISRSKLILNVHFYRPGIQEIVRLGHLWANKKCVICECNNDTTLFYEYNDCCIYTEYDNIVDTVRIMIGRQRSIKAIEDIAFYKFSKNTYCENIQRVLDN